MADNFDGYMTHVPTFPVQDGTTGTLTNLVHASEINMWIEGPNASGILVEGVRTLQVQEQHQGASLEFFAGSRRPEPKKGTRTFNLSFNRAMFDLAPMKEHIRHAYGLQSSGVVDVYLFDYPIRAIVRSQILKYDYNSVLSLMQDSYDELYFTGLTLDYVQSENGFFTESGTAIGAYQNMLGNGGSKNYTITTVPYSQGTFRANH